MTKAKTFRLPSQVIRYIEKQATNRHISQGAVINELVQLHQSQENQWKNDLKIVASDLEYKNESILMAEEHYE